MPFLASACYGKDNVRVCKVERDEKTGAHIVTEMTVRCLLEGDIETSYTQANNGVIVTTDSMKNTIYIKARQHPVNPPELFASILAQHFLDTYLHIYAAHITLTVHKWTRLTVNSIPHPHSFYRDGQDVRTVHAIVSRKAGVSLQSGLAGLSVLKSTGSSFHGFVRDEYTTLPETWDRILSTEVEASWTWRTFRDVADMREGSSRFDDAFEKARDITLMTFATDESASVQATMYKMSGQVLDAVSEVEKVAYQLPNKHYFEIDLSWYNGLKNTGKDAEVYAPQSGPNGLIKCEVTRSQSGN